MSVRRIKNHGTWVWQARVAYRGRRKAAFRETREAAREAESDLLRDLKAEATREEQEGAKPATFRQLLEFYVDDLQARGKRPETLSTAIGTAHVVELLMPDLLTKLVTRIGEADIFAFRRTRVEQSATAARLRLDAANSEGRWQDHQG